MGDKGGRRRRLAEFIIGNMLWIGIAMLLTSIVVKDRVDALHIMGIHYLADFMKEGGFALIISWIISRGIEELSRENFNNDIKSEISRIETNVFEAIFHKQHDKRLIERVVNSIFNSDFYRKNSDLKMSFRKIRKSDDISNPDTPLIVEINVKFEMHNISDADNIYKFQAFLEKPYDSSLVQHVKMIRLRIDDRIFTDSELIESDRLIEDNEDFIRYGMNELIEQGAFKEFEISYTMIKYARDEISWRQVEPCDGFSVTMTVPPELRAFGVPMHFRTDIRPRYPTADLFELVIPEPMFPHHGASLWWAPKSVAIPKPDLTEGQAALGMQPAPKTTRGKS